MWVRNSNGTSGRVGVQNSSLSKLLGWNWNLEKSIATGTHNSEPLEHLERMQRAQTQVGVCRTTPRPMGHLLGSCGTDCCESASRFRCWSGCPMDHLCNHCSTDVDPLLRWVLFAIIALTAILPGRFHE